MTANYHRQRGCTLGSPVSLTLFIDTLDCEQYESHMPPRAVAMLHNCRLHTCHRSCNLPIISTANDLLNDATS